MSQVSITQASKMAGVSRATIYNDIDSGTLSFTTGAKEKKMINVSELERVYKTLKTPDNNDESTDVKKRQERQKDGSKGDSDQIAVLQERLEAQKKQSEHLEELLKKEQEERIRERDAAKQFEEYMKEQLANQGENIKNFTRLIEDKRTEKSQAEDLQPVLKDMQTKLNKFELSEEQRIQNEKTAEREKNQLKQNLTKLENQLKDEKNKSFWDKLTGK